MLNDQQSFALNMRVENDIPCVTVIHWYCWRCVPICFICYCFELFL